MPLNEYEVTFQGHDGVRQSYHFKFIGQDKHHACCLPLELGLLLEDERYAQGGIHYLLPERAFWSMVANWHNHGSTLPHPGPCRCIRDPSGWLRLRQRFDDLFKAATGTPWFAAPPLRSL